MRNQLAQLLLLELPEAAWSRSLEQLLERFEPSGLLFAGSGEMSQAEATRKAARSLGRVPFLALAPAGGSRDWFAILARTERAARQDLTVVEKLGDFLGSYMEMIGFNLYFGPTLDLPAQHSETARGGSEASTSPATLTRCGEIFIRRLARHRIMVCARHFPSGAAPPSAQENLPVVAKSMGTLWREDLVPYRMLRDGLALIQVTHAAHKAYDYEFPRPASLSPAVVEGLLRMKLGYRGVALADASAAARAAGIEIGEAAVQALAAGCDLVLVPGEPSPLEGVFRSLERALETGRFSQERLEQALARVASAKKNLALPRKQFSHSELAGLLREFEAWSAQCQLGAQRIV
jgi:beta-N-acetylhexosaminidase